jgi:hypothetical protein
MNDVTVTRRIHFSLRNKGRRELQPGPQPLPDGVAAGRVPRISRLMALAIRFDRLIGSGGIADQADLARLGHVSRARVTQIMNLLHLAPAIQEELLFLPRTMYGRDPIAERQIRKIAAIPDWRKQHKLWREITSATATQPCAN